MRSDPSIPSLYEYALAEGEGVGTAYEYFAKRRVMAPLLSRLAPGATILVAGLPERYGTSLDFCLAARDRGAKVLVVDERQHAIDKARWVIAKLPALASLEIEWRPLARLEDVSGVGKADIALSCEVLQRVPAAGRRRWVAALRALCPLGALFVPNGDNASHTKISKLSGLTLEELRRETGATAKDSGYVDMPPFPPGITRSAAQRQRAATGVLEALAMHGLQGFALAEPFLPDVLKARSAHITFARWCG